MKYLTALLTLACANPCFASQTNCDDLFASHYSGKVECHVDGLGTYSGRLENGLPEGKGIITTDDTTHQIEVEFAVHNHGGKI